MWLGQWFHWTKPARVTLKVSLFQPLSPFNDIGDNVLSPPSWAGASPPPLWNLRGNLGEAQRKGCLCLPKLNEGSDSHAPAFECINAGLRPGFICSLNGIYVLNCTPYTSTPTQRLFPGNVSPRRQTWRRECLESYWAQKKHMQMHDFKCWRGGKQKWHWQGIRRLVVGKIASCRNIRMYCNN